MSFGEVGLSRLQDWLHISVEDSFFCLVSSLIMDRETAPSLLYQGIFQSYFTSSEAYPVFRRNAADICSCFLPQRKYFDWSFASVGVYQPFWLHFWNWFYSFWDLCLIPAITILTAPLWLTGRFYLEAKWVFWIIPEGTVITVGLLSSGTIGWTPVIPNVNSSCSLLFMQYLAFLFIIITASCLQLRACFAINFIVQD